MGIFPQILVIFFWILKIRAHALHDGERMENPPTEYSFKKVALMITIEAVILYAGGFWDCLLK